MQLGVDDWLISDRTKCMSLAKDWRYTAVAASLLMMKLWKKAAGIAALISSETTQRGRRKQQNLSERGHTCVSSRLVSVGDTLTNLRDPTPLRSARSVRKKLRKSAR